MKSLKESLLDVENTVDRATADMVNYKDYCKIKKFINSIYWAPGSSLIDYKFGKDNKGYYIKTSGRISFGPSPEYTVIKNVQDYLEESRMTYNKRCHRSCPPFYWKSHKGPFIINRYSSQFNSLEGLPDEIDQIEFYFFDDKQCRSIDCGKHIIEHIEIDTDMIEDQDVELTGNPKVNLITITKNTKLKTSFKPKKINIK